MNYEKTVEACREEWSKMHHNASVRSSMPDFKNEYEESLFWDVLADEARSWMEDLQEWLKEDFGVSLTFYSYGRGGATIAPEEWMGHVGGSGFGVFNEEKAIGYSEGLEGLNRARKVLKILRRINKYWNAEAKNIGTWWKDMKEANDYQEDIDAHDGMVLKTKRVWEKP